MKHEGNLEITESNVGDFLGLVEVTGSLYIAGNANLPLLTSVGGNLYINVDLTLPLLTSVCGYLNTSDVTLPLLTSVGGYLIICGNTNLPLLTSVGGNLCINVDLTLPLLTSVGRDLHITSDANLPLLTSVGRYLIIRTGADVKFPILTSVRGVKGKLICVSTYGLLLSDDGYYYAGCRLKLSKEQALAHWDREDERALKFTAAILDQK